MSLPSNDLTAAIAATRFGLGGRPGELARLSHDPKGWLIEQIRPDAVIQPLNPVGLPFADSTDVTWSHGCHPFVPWARSVPAHKRLSTLVPTLARRNRVLSRLAVASAVLDDLASILSATTTVRHP